MSKGYCLKTKELFIGDLAIDSDAIVYALWTVPHAIKISAIRLGVKTAVTAANTNYNTLSIKNGSVTVATLANGPVSGGTSIVAGAFGSFTVVTAAGAAEVAAASVLTLATVKTGNGLAMAGCNIQIEYYDYDA